MIEIKDNFGCHETLARAIRGAHFIDIRVRVDGKYHWFEADFLKHIFEQVQFIPGNEVQSCKGRDHHIGDRFK